VTLPTPWRKTTQELLPTQHTPTAEGQYDVYGSFPLGSDVIERGYDALAEKLRGHARVILDGYGGVFWSHFRTQLDAALHRRGVRATWISVDHALKAPDAVERLVAPFLGGDDPIFGTRFTGHLQDFFDNSKLSALQPDERADMSIVYGSGAALGGWDGYLVYVDLPKNEIQFRSRAGTIRNLGRTEADDPKRMYKRFYFVDWIALNGHKANLLPRIDLIVDEQRPDEPALADGAVLRGALDTMAHNVFRVRPWFEPGPWGGQWLKEHMPQLPQDAPNYAWSFELIVPENGLLLESDGQLLEVSFDFLMFHNHHAVVGDPPRVSAMSFRSASTSLIHSTAAIYRYNATRDQIISATTLAKPSRRTKPITSSTARPTPRYTWASGRISIRRLSATSLSAASGTLRPSTSNASSTSSLLVSTTYS
jgi:hypothetical protein